MTKEQLRDQLYRMQAKAGGTAYQLAAELGIDAPTLSSVMRGRRDPSEKLLKSLGLEVVVSYRKVKA